MGSDEYKGEVNGDITPKLAAKGVNTPPTHPRAIF